MNTYDAVWLMKRQGGKWCEQGMVHSKEASFRRAKDVIVKRLVHTGFIGDVVFRESAVLEDDPEALDIFQVNEDGSAMRLTLEDGSILRQIYDQCVEKQDLQKVLQQNKCESSFNTSLPAN